MSNLTVVDAIRNMAKYDLIRNIDKGAEYTGFKGLYCDGMMEKKHVSHGMVYDVTDKNIHDHHLLNYMEKLLKEEPSHVVMTSGTFLFMNEPLQQQVAEWLKELSKRSPVTLYVSDAKEVKIDHLFIDSNVIVKVYNRNNLHIIHFVKSKNSFNFVMPHTEDKYVRVDLNSENFEPKNKERILAYFDKLIKEFDEAIEKNNRMSNNAKTTSLC